MAFMSNAETFAIVSFKEDEGCLISTFCNPLRFTKNGVFSGCLNKINIYKNSFENSNIKNLKRIIETERTIKINNYQYHIHSDEIFNILNKLTENILLLGKSRSDKIVKIENVDKKENKILIKLTNNELLCFNLKTIKSELDNSFNLIPIIHLKLAKGTIIADLCFESEATGVNINKYLNLKQSICWEEKLISFGFKHFGKGRLFQISEHEFNHLILNNLLKAGFKVFYFDGKTVSRSQTPKASYNKKQDWFDFQFSIINEKGEEEDITKSIILNRNSKYIRIKEQIVELPSALQKKKWEVHTSGDQAKIAIKKKSLLYIDEVFNECGISKSALNTLYPYNNVKLNLSDTLIAILRNYQREGVKWLKFIFLNKLGGILADDMGLGKTLQCISLCSDQDIISKTGPILIVTTKSLKDNWFREFEKFSPSLTIHDFSTIRVHPISPTNNSIYVATYGNITSNVSILKTLSFKVAFFDEIQVAKNAETRVFKSLKHIKAETKIGLSGTPLENNLIELWSVYSLVFPELFGTKSDFFNTYATNPLPLKSHLSPFMLRRTKSQVLKELPDFIEKIVYCPFDKGQKSVYERLLKSFKEDLRRKLRRGEIYDTSRCLKYLLYLREACCNTLLLPDEYNPNGIAESIKNSYLLREIKNRITEHKKCVIFGQFVYNLQLLRESFIRQGCKVFYIDGSTSGRQAIIDSFNQSEDSILIISLKTGGLGLNLTSASYAYIIDPWWNPAVEKQAADRLYRMGQTRNVTIIKLIASGTIEEKIQSLQKEKEELFEKVIEGNKTKAIDLIDELKKYIMS